MAVAAEVVVAVEVAVAAVPAHLRVWHRGSIQTHRVFLLYRRLQALLHPVQALLLLRQELLRLARVLVVAAVVVVAAVAPLFRRSVLQDAEASWLPGTQSLRKKHGVVEPAPVRVLTPVGPLPPLETSCSPMSRIVSMLSRPTQVSSFSTSQPEWEIPVLR